jgi:hypothetical protein
MLSCTVSRKLTDALEVVTASAIRAVMIMGAVNTSDTSINFYETTRRNIPQHDRNETCILREMFKM